MTQYKLITTDKRGALRKIVDWYCKYGMIDELYTSEKIKQVLKRFY